MFLPWSFFLNNLFFLALDILVTAFVTSVLAHASRHFQHHALSIRWIQQGGFLEMLNAVKSSWRVRNVPYWAMWATFLGGYSLFGITLGVKKLVHATTGERGPSTEVVVSRQFVVNGSSISYLPAWSIPAAYSTSMADSLARALNSTYAIPRASPTKRYRPRLSKYELACDQLSFKLGDSVGNDSLILSNTGCANFTLFTPVTMDVNLTGSYFIQKSNGRAKIVVPVFYNIGQDTPPGVVSEVSTIMRVKVSDSDFCLIVDTVPQLFFASRSGLSSYPLTVLTKCQHPSGIMVSFATSAVRFSVPELESFHPVATSLFGTQDDLVSSMETAVNNLTLITPSSEIYSQVAVIELKIVGTEISFLMCVSSKQAPGTHLACSYTVAHVLITLPRPMNPDITQMFPDEGISTYSPLSALVMSFDHLPRISMDKPIFNISKVLTSSPIATDYLAALGQNFILDWGGSTLYIAYDTVNIVNGYEIPTWLFWTLVGVMGAFLVFFGATEYWLKSKYTRSLYFMVAKEFTAGKKNTNPELHQFNTKNLEFEDRPLLSTEAPQALEEIMAFPESNSGSENPLRHY